MSVFPTSMASSIRVSNRRRAFPPPWRGRGREGGGLSSHLDWTELQHLVHAPRPVALQVERDVLEPELLDPSGDRLCQPLREEALYIVGGHFDARDLAMVADPNL